mgnify:CR=1 FL=1
MKALIQRVSSAKVVVNEQNVGSIDRGMLVLLAIEKQDSIQTIDKMCHKLLNYRVFPDQDNKMNLNVQQVEGELLVVSQFTLAADTQKGMRPSFSCAAEPERAREYYLTCVEQLKSSGLLVKTGEFAADMQVSLCNDGPVTFMLSC